MERLRAALKGIDGKGYKAYKDIKGLYNFDGYSLSIDHVQGDPFAAPSRISIKVPSNIAALPANLYSTKGRKIALEDCLSRALSRAIRSVVKGSRGIGKSGQVRIETSGQQVLVRDSLLIDSGNIEARLTVGLPAAGRTILAREAGAIFFKEIPEVVKRGLFYKNLDADKVKCHVETVEDQEYLRSWLREKKLIAFIADGSLLPRLSGVDDRPLSKDVLPFKSPDSMAFTADLPNNGKIRGMGIPEGVTLIVGGGFHGKSTLLHALERGVYNHIPGDGRERVVTEPTAVKIRAEDGRVISEVNISPFIDNLPFDRDTVRFSTENGSGSTSQAANIIEALECGTKTLLVDEDTSATNFMIRDERMQALVSKEKEPITPFLHRVKELYEEKGVSSIIVMGGSGDYFSVADRVIMMNCYEPHDVSEKARSLAEPLAIREAAGKLHPFEAATGRIPERPKLDPSRGRREVKIDARNIHNILYGEHSIDLSKVEQLVDIGQTRAIGLLIYYYSTHYVTKTNSFVEGLTLALEELDREGLDMISPYNAGDLALPRLHEVAAAINRIRARDRIRARG